MTFQSADAAPATGERNKVDEGANADCALKAAEPHQSHDGAAARSESLASGSAAVRIINADVRAGLAQIADDSVDCVVTSPPYWGLRDYGVDGQIGMERTLGEHLSVLVDVFRDVRRVLKPQGTLWLNYGDCYATSPNGRSAADTKAAGNDDRTFRDKPFSTIQGVLKAKDLCMVANRLAIALQEDGWWVRSEIVWGKPNPMPDSSGRYRPSTAHEKIFMLAKSGRHFYDAAAVRLPAAESSTARWAQDVEGRDGSARANAGGKTNGPMKAVGGRPQRARAEQIALRAGLTPEHFAAIKSAGIADTGKALVTTTGAGRNTEEVLRLAGEAKVILGGYYREFLYDSDTRLLRNYEPAPAQVWEIPTQSYADAHFATFPPELAERCIKAGCPAGGHVLDPFGGAGTTGLVAARMGRSATLIELNAEYAALAESRLKAALVSVDGNAKASEARVIRGLPLFAGAA